MSINILSLFNGISCGQVALDRCGVCVNKYFASEIDKFAIKVTNHNYPNTIHVGDILKLKGKDFPRIDLIIGGSPCQGFSFAGKHLNFEDPRSKLFFEFVRLIREIKPKYFLFENVVMKKEYSDIISEYLECKPNLINSSLFSAQNRKRLYWTNIPYDVDILDRGITWKDIKEKSQTSKEFYYTKKALKLHVHPSQKDTSTERLFGSPHNFPTDNQCVAAMRGRYLVNGKRQDGKQKTKGLTNQYVEFRYDGKSNTLTTVAKDNIVVPFSLPNRILVDEFFFRYLTPIEYERLQTIPDNFTNCVSSSQRRRLIGNAWTVDVICHILKGIA